jgi:multiple sugar transport system permease protein
MARRMPDLLGRVALGICVAVLLAFFLGPILWMVLASLQPETAVTQAPPDLTLRLDFHRYVELMQTADWVHSVLVSLEVALATTTVTIVLGAVAAYPLARLAVPGRRPVMLLLIGTTMMPAVVLAIPVLFMITKVHLQDTVTALVLINSAFQLPVVIWLLFTFFQEVPVALDHAARMDGCTRLGALVRVTVPAASPGLAATAILILISTWNEFLFALVIGSENAVTVTRWVAIVRSIGAGGAGGAPPYTQVAAVGVLAVLPCLVLVLVFHRRIVTGITGSFMKG